MAGVASLVETGVLEAALREFPELLPLCIQIAPTTATTNAAAPSPIQRDFLDDAPAAEGGTVGAEGNEGDGIGTADWPGFGGGADNAGSNF